MESTNTVRIITSRNRLTASNKAPTIVFKPTMVMDTFGGVLNALTKLHMNGNDKRHNNMYDNKQELSEKASQFKLGHQSKHSNTPVYRLYQSCL